MKDSGLKALILDINNSGLNTVKGRLVNSTFELSPYSFLTKDLSGWIGAFIIRAILCELRVDEHHVFKWRPENKYIQYLILSHYSPGCMPKTLSLTDLLNKNDGVQNIRKLIKSGYFIKATLGFGSGRTQNFDRTAEFEQILSDHQSKHSFQNEKWIIQKRLNLDKEFRIHTFGKDILYGLTSRIGGIVGLKDYDQPQEFVESILAKLPSSFLEGTLIGWDIGLTKKGKYYVIEANFTGFHPEYHAGFQTTGHVDDPPFGPIVCAWLHAYFRNKYKVSITSFDDILLKKFPYIEEFSYYISILKSEHIQEVFKTKGRLNSIYVYLDEKTDYNIIKLVTYMQLANFADNFYIISNSALHEDAKKSFAGGNVTHTLEHYLFTEDEYKHVQQLDYESKKQLCCDNINKLTDRLSHIVIK